MDQFAAVAGGGVWPVRVAGLLARLCRGRFVERIVHHLPDATGRGDTRVLRQDYMGNETKSCSCCTFEIIFYWFKSKYFFQS